MNKIAFNRDVRNRRGEWANTGIIKPAYAFMCPFTDTLVFGIFHRNAAGEKPGEIRLERNNKAREYTKRILGQKSLIVSCLDAGKMFGESIYYAGDGDTVGTTHFHSFSGSLEGAVKGLIEHISPRNIVKAKAGAVVKAIQNICGDPGNLLFPYVKLTKEAVRGAGIMISLDWEKEEQLAQAIKKITGKKGRKL